MTGRPLKPLVDWKAIEERWKAGESASRLAEQYPISRQAIGRMATRRGWLRDGEAPPENLQPEDSGLGHPDHWKAVLKDTNAAQFDSFDPYSCAQILAAIARKVPVSVACDMTGHPVARIRAWRRDMKLDSLFRMAVAHAKADLVAKIEAAGDEDWRASAWLLERSPESREDYGQQQAVETPPIRIEVSVVRDPAIAMAAGVKTIDLEAEDVSEDGAGEGAVRPDRALPPR